MWTSKCIVGPCEQVLKEPEGQHGFCYVGGHHMYMSIKSHRSRGKRTGPFGQTENPFCKFRRDSALP